MHLDPQAADRPCLSRDNMKLHNLAEPRQAVMRGLAARGHDVSHNTGSKFADTDDQIGCHEEATPYPHELLNAVQGDLAIDHVGDLIRKPKRT